MYNSQKWAYKELSEMPERVWCHDCGEPTILIVIDHSFGHAFGVKVQYNIGTSCCNGDNWTERFPCQHGQAINGITVCLLDDSECDKQSLRTCKQWEEA